MPRFAPPWSKLRDSFARAERWLLPGACLLCGESTEPDPAEGEDPLVCGTCCLRFPRLPEPQCHRCGQPLVPGISCRLCAGWPASLASVRSAVWLDQSARRAVHLLKYDGWWRLAEALARVMSISLAWPAPLSLVPIPLSAARERSRGYNQSDALAHALANRIGARVRPVLRRRRDTATQTALTPEARRANLAGAFEAIDALPVNPVLVDDVFTTGATLAEAAQALEAAGAARVGGVTFARAIRPLADAAGTLSSR